jgi:hypothetical protein
MIEFDVSGHLRRELASAETSGSELRRHAAEAAIINSGILPEGSGESAHESVLPEIEYMQTLVTARTFEQLSDV